jgi:predicted methyltransferase
MRIFLTLFTVLTFTLFQGSQGAHADPADSHNRLEALIASDARPAAQKLRDVYRHPLQTLTFFDVKPDMTLVEIWPGGQGGWYRKILEPFIDSEKGRYIPVRQRSAFPDQHPDIPYGNVDMVLVFRAHGFMIYKEPAQKHVDAIFSMLKPGGILGIVDHAGDESIPQDPKGDNGYVNASHFRMLAEKAGFELVEESDVNSNTADTKDHPKGVWSLPPTLAGSRLNPKMRDHYKAVGESDRFTMKFRKPIKE